ncbi:MAG TPA: substrate-binding domain-containing protein [Candidatus Limnocylindrales bacterium]|nr:substrate-binding domain-containing protein [Candidatus Limnocylindrales bacterium]
MKPSRIFSVLSIAVVALVVWGCEKPYHQPEEKYILVAANVNLPYWQDAQAGLTDIGKTTGVKVDLVGPTSFSPTEELAAFKDAVAKHPSGILVSVSDPKLFKEPIDAAILSGLPVVCIDADAPDSHRVMFIGTDNFRAGVESAKHMAALLGGQGRVLLIGLSGQLNTEERLRGVNDALKGNPGMKIIQTVDDKGDARNAYDAVSALLQKHERIDGIIGLEASGGEGAAEALHRMDLTGKVKILAFDKDPQTLEGIERGWITATVAQKPYVMAFYGVRFLDDLHHNAVHEFKDWATAPAAPLPVFVDTGTAIIDQTNLATFRKALAEHPKPVI